MANKGFSLITLIMLFEFSMSAQYNFTEWEILEAFNDRVTRVKYDTCYFNYFSQEYRQDEFVFRDTIIFEMKLTTYRENGNGELCITFEGDTLCRFQIRNYLVSGFGYSYDGEGNVVFEGQFYKDRLHGILICYGKSPSRIMYIAKYRRGRFKEYLYFSGTHLKEKIEQGNKELRKPFSNGPVKM